MPVWWRLNSGAGEPAFNMALDEALLHAMPRLRRPVLRFYGWTEPAASFGYFQNYAEVERMTGLRPLVRRPTGGGLVPHDADWTYSLTFPTLDAWYSLSAVASYRRVHEWIRVAFTGLDVSAQLAPARLKAQPGQCFAGYEQSDVLWHGQKIAGAAQRRTRDGLLIQGSIRPPPAAGWVRQNWEAAMCEAASSTEGVRWEKLELDGALSEYVAVLVREKYSLAAYHQKR